MQALRPADITHSAAAKLRSSPDTATIAAGAILRKSTAQATRVSFSEVPLWIIFLLSLGLIFGAIELGRRLGASERVNKSETVTMLVGALLGLLALIMGFTFSVALSRFDARLDAVLEEANAIGTTALRARLLPEPEASASLKLLRDYVQVRLEVTQKAASPAEVATAVERSNQIQEALWLEAKAAATKDSAMVPTGLYLQTLNETIDAQEKRLTAFRNRVPEVVFAALYGIAILTACFTGYSGWSEGQRSRVSVYLVYFVVASVILLIQDLDRPGPGLINVSQQPLIDLSQTLAGYMPKD
jgi:hypothetical protein